MKKIFIIFYFLNILVFAQTNMEIQNIINNIKLKYAPDKRTAIFNVDYSIKGERIFLKGETNLVDAKESLLKKLPSEYTIQDSISILPSKELGNKIYAVINLSVLNMRVKPDHPEEMATQSLLGFPVKVLKKKNEWYYIQTPDNYLGWAEIDGLELMDADEFIGYKSSPKIVYLNNFGNILSEPSKNSTPVSDVVAGDILVKLDVIGEFIKVQFPDGRVGFVENTSVEDFDRWCESRSLTSENILKTASRFMGLPYLWGGTSMKGVDCSGFTKSVYYLNGLIVPRDASQQAYVGDSVDITNNFEKLKPGDLLFFGTKQLGDKKERVTHVAIYKGNMEFIHSSGKVRVNSLDKDASNFSAHRFNTLLRARRFINAINTDQLIPLKNLFN